MTASCYEIGALIIRIENDFLERPGLALTLREAEQRFATDRTICEAVLAALVDAHVLARTPHGAYARHFPPLAQHAASRTTVNTCRA